MDRIVSEFCGEDIRLTDLVTQQDPALVGIGFERCRISGPAVLHLVGSLMAGNDYGIDIDHIDAALWTVSPWTEVVQGSVMARNCVFRDCTFMGIAFVGGEELTAKLRAAVTSASRIAS